MTRTVLCGGLAAMGPVAACLTLLTLSGCGASDIMPIEGTVLYNGKPIAEGKIGFYPENGRPAYGDITDGAFVLTTHKPGDGALIGIHRVTVHSDRPSDPSDAFSDRVSLIPVRYNRPASSGLTAEVLAGANPRLHFELTD